MPPKLSEPPEESIRQFFTDNARSSAMQGYNPQQTDTSQQDFLPITTDWSDWGDTYPNVTVVYDDANVVGGGETSYTGVKSSGGLNQFTQENCLVSVQAVEELGYLNDTDPRVLTREIYDELHHQIQNNVSGAISEAEYVAMGPPTLTQNEEEVTSGSTITWFQQQGVATLAWNNTES